jgi:hypothetical protein
MIMVRLNGVVGGFRQWSGRADERSVICRGRRQCGGLRLRLTRPTGRGTTLVGQVTFMAVVGRTGPAKTLRSNEFASGSSGLRHSAAILVSVHYRSLTPQPARGKAADPMLSGERGAKPGTEFSP